MDTEMIISYPPTAPVQSQMNVNVLTMDSSSVQDPPRMNVARHLFNFFNQQPRPVPTTMPQGGVAQNGISGAQQNTAASSNTYRPYLPRATTQLNRHLENQSLPRRAVTGVESVPPASNVRRREREPSAASGESTPFEGQTAAERVTKVQLVEQESLQVTEQLAQQAAAIEYLKQQVSWGTGILCVVLMMALVGRTRRKAG